MAGTGLVGSSLRQSHTLGSPGGNDDDNEEDNDRKAEESVRESLAILAKILGESNGAAAGASTSANVSRSASPAPTIRGKAITAVKTAEEEEKSKSSARIKEEDLELEVDFGGLSLREYLAQEEDIGEERIHRPQTVEECTCVFLLASVTLTLSFLSHGFL